MKAGFRTSPLDISKRMRTPLFGAGSRLNHPGFAGGSWVPRVSRSENTGFRYHHRDRRTRWHEEATRQSSADG